MPARPSRATLLEAALALPAGLGRLGAAEVEPAVGAAIGGQAVIEGVMMRGPARWTVTVRRPDGRLETSATPYRSWAKKIPLLGQPFLRGAAVLLESMIVGLKALNYSAEIAAEAEAAGAASSSEPAAGSAQPALGFWALALTLAGALALALGLFVALPHLLSLALGHAWGFDETSGWFHLADGLFKFALFIAYVWGIGLIPEIGRVYAYHGAEHQAIFAFEAGDAPLTPAQAARHPTCHPRCGTAFIFLVLALSILFFAAVFPLFFPAAAGFSPLRTLAGIGLKIILMLPLAGLAYEVTRLAGRASPKSFWRKLLGPGLLLQRLTTRRPDEAQLEVALTALNQAVGP
ncbi:MAG: DUF1385 domain-containing protein [Candidatus Adiutrix sp.]|jgi:uncharacterized protein YqhQ|nr:DUF1385 domain-containing protein [Candidatus Adiutrix sp.]